MIPGLHVFERDWLSSNCVLFEDAESATLIDSGYLKHAQITAALVARTLGGRPLDRLINTHLHSDHCGGNARLHELWQCQIVVPQSSLAAVARWDAAALSFVATGQRCDRFTAAAGVAPGATLMLGATGWEVIAAPGHDPDAIVLWSAEHRILIAGDALWEKGFGVIFPELTGEGGFAEQRAILDRIATLDVRTVIPGHGRAFSGFAGALDSAYSLLERLANAPDRHARHAVKVLLKFLLLDWESVALAQLPERFANIPLVAASNDRFLGGMDAQELARWAAQELVRSGAAHIHNGILYNG